MILGFLTKSDIEVLQDEVITLKAEMAIKDQQINTLKTDMETLQKFCYNAGGEITELKNKYNKLHNSE